MKQRRAIAIFAAAAAALFGSLVVTSSAFASSARGGALNVTKNCSGFSGNPFPQSFCVITSSNVKAIEVGSKVLYLQPSDLGTPAGSDVILDPPGSGHGKGLGHCALVPTDNFNGACSFSGGTGEFKYFHATVIVTNLDGVNYSWAGTYTFSASHRGSLNVTKNCSGFSGNPFPQSFCVITSSNTRAIEVGSKVLYLQPSDLGTPAGSDVIIDPPGPGNSKAFGHCALVPTNNFNGVCSFSGGTGNYKWFQATVIVTNLDGVNYSWAGTYTFSRPCRRG